MVLTECELRLDWHVFRCELSQPCFALPPGPDHVITAAVHRVASELKRLVATMPQPEEEVDPEELRLGHSAQAVVRQPTRAKKRAAPTPQRTKTGRRKRTPKRRRPRDYSFNQPTLRLEYMEVEVLPRLLRHAASRPFQAPVNRADVRLRPDVGLVCDG